MHSETVVIAQHMMSALFLIFLVGTLGGKLAGKLMIPDVSVYIVIGIFMGPAVFGWLSISAESGANQFILMTGAAFILFHGGMITGFDILKKVWRTVTLLSTLGVLVTAIIVALAATSILNIPFLPALLLGAIIASTDPAALVPIFHKFPVRRKVAQTVITESAFTDATGAILAVVVFDLMTSGSGGSVWTVVLQFVQLAFGGIVVGVVFGWIAAFLISENDRGLLREFTPLVVVLAVLGTYLVAERLHVSGFMGVFVAGLMLGNARHLKLTISPKIEHASHEFIEMAGLKLRMLIFILLGSQVDLNIVSRYWWQGLLIVLIFMFIARPATVLVSLLPDRKAGWSRNEIVFFFWTRETGVIAAALIGIAASSGLAEGPLLAAITFMVVFVTIVLQSSTTPTLAKKLDLLEKEPHRID